MSKIALITGGSRRLGRAICVRLASEGYGILIHYLRSQDEALRTRDACMDAGAPLAEIIQCDLGDGAQRAGLISRAIDKAGRLDLLVNSASMFQYDDAGSFTDQTMEAHLQTNYLAPVELTMALYRASQIKNDGNFVHVVTLLDQKIVNLNIDYMSYTLAKLASHSSIRYLAQCCAPHLRVNAVAPGVTLISGEMDATDFAKAHQIAALGRSSTSGDIAEAILMLDRAPAMTGQTIIVDGGQHLIPRGRDVAFEV